MVVLKNVVKKNFYRDSVQLLHISEEAKKIDGVVDAAIVMGTDLNKEILEKEGLLTEEGRTATENDMIIAVKVKDESLLNSVIERIEELLTGPTTGEQYFYSIEAAIEYLKGANLALVSIPGQYAKEAVKPLLERGIHVHLFSDHVPLNDEIELKKLALSKGLLLMGPEAGTSIINGVAIAFANVVNRGPIGIVAAAGTGLQEVSVLISRAGSGISQGIGVGGRDVKSPVGGMMTIFSIKVLDEDPETKVITIVSKPPSPDVQDRILEFIGRNTKKKFVTSFIGGKTFKIPESLRGRLVQTKTLHAAALESVRLIDESLYESAIKRISLSQDEVLRIVDSILSKLDRKQRYVRGLFTGGTLTYETLIIFKELYGDIYSNTPLNPNYKLANPWRSYKHSVVDLGEEEFTAGRAHPMIDPTIRLQRIVEEARDSEVAVIMLDFVLGYGSHPDPVGAHLSAIKEAKKIAEKDGRYLAFLAHVCGTERDPQNAVEQEEKLKANGVIVLPTNALMALVAAIIAKGGIREEELSTFFTNYLGGLR